MSDLRVSQRAVVAERLQSTRTDAQLLADLLVIHPTAEPFPFPLAEDFIYPVGQEVSLPTISSYLLFEMITTSILIIFTNCSSFCLQSKAVVRLKQWICNEVAACGSKWSGVALSVEPVTAVSSVRGAKKSEVRHNSVVQRKAKSGIIQPLCTCVAAFGVGVVACGVLRFLMPSVNMSFGFPKKPYP